MTEDNKPEVADSSDQIDQPVENNEIDSIFDEEGEKDVEVEKLSLEELNTLAGRKDNPFKTKEDYFKHYKNLSSLVGKKEAPTPKKENKEKSEVEILRKELAAERFFSNNPTAKNYAKFLEAYADKNNLTLDEVWQSEEAKALAEASNKKILSTNNRISPPAPRVPQDLVNEAKKGSEKAQLEVVDKWFAGK